MRLTCHGVEAFRGLGTVRKRPSIRNASKGPGNKGRVIYITESAEDVVFFAESVVHAHVKLVRVIARNWVCRIIIEKSGVRRGRIQIEKLDGILVQAICRNHVAHERLADKSDLRYSGGLTGAAGGSRQTSESVRSSAEYGPCCGRIEHLSQWKG